MENGIPSNRGITINTPERTSQFTKHTLRTSSSSEQPGAPTSPNTAQSPESGNTTTPKASPRGKSRHKSVHRGKVFRRHTSKHNPRSPRSPTRALHEVLFQNFASQGDSPVRRSPTKRGDFFNKKLSTRSHLEADATPTKRERGTTKHGRFGLKKKRNQGKNIVKNGGSRCH